MNSEGKGIDTLVDSLRSTPEIELTRFFEQVRKDEFAKLKDFPRERLTDLQARVTMVFELEVLFKNLRKMKSEIQNNS